MIKKIFLFFLASYLSLNAATAFADVKFEIHFIDPPGEGFHVLPEARKCLGEAAAIVGSWLDHDAVVRVSVESFAGINGGAYVEDCPIKERFTPGIFYTPAARKILFNQNQTQKHLNYDVVMGVYFPTNSEYAYGDEVPEDKVDFKSIIIHELTHALGFSSCISKPILDLDPNRTAKSIDELRLTLYLMYQRLDGEIENQTVKEGLEKLLNYIGVPAETFLSKFDMIMIGGQGFSKFDTLFVDEDGEKIIDTESFQFKRKDLNGLEDGDKRKMLYIRYKKNNGKTYLSPFNLNDLSHVSRGGNYLMNPSTVSGPAPRHWSLMETQIMEALGYKLKPAKKYSWVWKVEEAI